jgi:uroporphyrinogen-III decarboxylase
MTELNFAHDQIQPRSTIQGNLDPLALLSGGVAAPNAGTLVEIAFPPSRPLAC